MLNDEDKQYYWVCEVDVNACVSSEAARNQWFTVKWFSMTRKKSLAAVWFVTSAFPCLWADNFSCCGSFCNALVLPPKSWLSALAVLLYFVPYRLGMSEVWLQPLLQNREAKKTPFRATSVFCFHSNKLDWLREKTELKSLLTLQEFAPVVLIVGGCYCLFIKLS